MPGINYQEKKVNLKLNLYNFEPWVGFVLVVKDVGKIELFSRARETTNCFFFERELPLMMKY